VERIPTLDAVRNLPALLERAAAAASLTPLASDRIGGGWRRLDAAALLGLTRSIAGRLQAAGMQVGERVGLMGPSSGFWLAADLGIQLAGGITVPLFADASAEHLAHIAGDAGLQRVVVDGDDCTDALHAALGGALAILPRAALEEAGPAATPATLRSEDLATLIYTSGSTGHPKGVALSHGNLLYQVRSAVAAFALDGSSDRALSCLPLAHVFERMVCLSYLAAGVPIHFVADIRQLGRELTEVQPTCLSVVPRVLERFRARIIAKTEQDGALRGGIARWALGRAARHQRGWLHGLADRLVYAPVRQALGGHLRCLIVGGAALDQDLEAFFRGLGIPLYQGYGMTEASPVITVNRPGDERASTAGRPFPGTEIRIGAQGEIQVRGPGVMRGYFHQPGSGPDAEGWLATGDRGELDADGYLRITGRLSSVVKTAGGKFIDPEAIEGRLAGHPLLDRAFVIAEARPWPAALLFLDPEALGRWADRHRLAPEAAMRAPALRQDLEAWIQRANGHLDRWERVRRFHLLLGPVTVASGLLTPTQKPRRPAIMQRHADAIAALYSEAEQATTTDPQMIGDAAPDPSTARTTPP
jgi:long-chain acyl-CoA synthetase